MINEILEIFLGAYYNHVPADYEGINYFTSIISVGTFFIITSGAIILACILAAETLKTIRGLTK